jgi:hypothetical protein
MRPEKKRKRRKRKRTDSSEIGYSGPTRFGSRIEALVGICISRCAKPKRVSHNVDKSRNKKSWACQDTGRNISFVVGVSRTNNKLLKKMKNNSTSRGEDCNLRRSRPEGTDNGIPKTRICLVREATRLPRAMHKICALSNEATACDREAGDPSDHGSIGRRGPRWFDALQKQTDMFR